MGVVPFALGLLGTIGIQLICFRSSRKILQLLPVLTVVAGMGLCFGMYALSSFQNWAYLILIMLLFYLLAFLGLLWLIYGVCRGIKCYRND